MQKGNKQRERKILETKRPKRRLLCRLRLRRIQEGTNRGLVSSAADGKSVPLKQQKPPREKGKDTIYLYYEIL